MYHVGLTCPKIIAYLIERVVLFHFPSSFPINSIQETSILQGVFYGNIFWELFSVNLIFFAIYVKDS